MDTRTIKELRDVQTLRDFEEDVELQWWLHSMMHNTNAFADNMNVSFIQPDPRDEMPHRGIGIDGEDLGFVFLVYGERDFVIAKHEYVKDRRLGPDVRSVNTVGRAEVQEFDKVLEFLRNNS